MTELYNLPRETDIDVTHLGLMFDDDKTPITKAFFDHVDGPAAICYANGRRFLLYSTVEVELWKNV